MLLAAARRRLAAASAGTSNDGSHLMRVVGNLIKAAVIMAAVSCAGSGALARTAFDGPWTVTMRTVRGSCSAFTSFGVQVVNGYVLASGGGFTLRGRVSPRGEVRATVGSADQVTQASGHLSYRSGGGRWVSPRKGCAGYWTAAR
jgi:hypothetical protein